MISQAILWCHRRTTDVATGTVLRFDCVDALAHWGDAELQIAERWAVSAHPGDDVVLLIVIPLLRGGGETEYRGMMTVHRPVPPAAESPALGEVIYGCEFGEGIVWREHREAHLLIFIRLAVVCSKVLPSETALPVDRYLAHDKVLFYDDVILYEDGHGHGYVKLQVKIVRTPRSELWGVLLSLTLDADAAGDGKAVPGPSAPLSKQTIGGA